MKSIRATGVFKKIWEIRNASQLPILIERQWKVAMPRASSIASASETNVVSFVGKKLAARQASGDDETSLALLMERASNVARQMRYFGLIAERACYDELLPSAVWAGFSVLSEDKRNQEVSFQSAAGKPDFVFSVSLKNPPSIVALSLGDFFGLTLTSNAHATGISVETSPSVGYRELGRNASALRDILLTLPDFDDTPAWTKFG